METTTFLSIEERAEALKETLYYDLLEKYLILKQSRAVDTERIKQLKTENLAFREHEESSLRTISAHNSLIDMILNLCYKHKENYIGLSIALKKLKIIY